MYAAETVKRSPFLLRCETGLPPGGSAPSARESAPERSATDCSPSREVRLVRRPTARVSSLPPVIHPVRVSVVALEDHPTRGPGKPRFARSFAGHFYSQLAIPRDFAPRSHLRGVSFRSATLPLAGRFAPRSRLRGASLRSAWFERRHWRLSSLREIKDFPLAVRTRRVLTTLPDDVRQAARILGILATSRESALRSLERSRYSSSASDARSASSWTCSLAPAVMR